MIDCYYLITIGDIHTGDSFQFWEVFDTESELEQWLKQAQNSVECDVLIGNYNRVYITLN